MDPEATLKRIAEALNDEDYDEAIFLTEELRHWRGRGGFRPTGRVVVEGSPT